MDSKLSAFPVVASLSLADKLPVLQDGQNKLATIGQVKAAAVEQTSASVSDSLIPLLNVVGVTGNCVLPVGTSRIILIAEGTGSVSSVGLLPLDGFRFTVGNSLELVWFGAKWNVLLNNGLTPGLV